MIDEKNFMSFMEALENAGAEHISFDDLREFINEFPKINKWIPCEERLPTIEECLKNQCNFILDNGNKRYGGVFDLTKQCFLSLNSYGGMCEDQYVIAWQPFPDGYNNQTN